LDPNALPEDFVPLIEQHQPLLHKLCRMYSFPGSEPEDLFQEMVFQLWKAYPSFRGESKFSTWLYRIALNTAISSLRRRKKQVRSVDPVSLPPAGMVERYPLEEQEQLDSLYAAIGQLPDIEKAIVMLFLEDRSYAEMEEILGMSENSLRVRMNRIREKLRQITKERPHGT
jgi:RNA polymerase sigma-70 factor (ECF subfamily)